VWRISKGVSCVSDTFLGTSEHALLSALSRVHERRRSRSYTKIIVVVNTGCREFGSLQRGRRGTCKAPCNRVPSSCPVTPTLCSKDQSAAKGQRRDEMSHDPDYGSLLRVAIEEAHQGLAEGGIPIGAALFDSHGNLLGRGHNRRVQEGDPSMHAETDAF